MAKIRTTVLLSANARQQVEQLAVRHGSLTEAMAASIDALYRIEYPSQYSLYDAVRARVRASKELAPLEDTILYDWPEGDQHLQWVLTAPDEEVLDWAQTVEKEATV